MAIVANKLVNLLGLTLAGCVASFLIPDQLCFAETNSPLLIPNKKNLYQRVLSLPSAELYPNEKLNQKNGIKVPSFSIYYVYKRLTAPGGGEWLQVGLSRHGQKNGWIKADKTIDWNQGLTLRFRPLTGHDRVLLFNDKKSVEQLAENYDLAQYKKLYAAASRGERPKNSPVIAIQPATDIDISENFYLLPIHDYEDIYLKDSTAKLLQVSSIPLMETPRKRNQVLNKNSDAYTAAIAFTIDSTFSMQPYIDRTRQAVKKIYDTLQQAKLLGQVRFGLVSFRDNTRAAPGVGYLTRRYVSLKQGENATTFMQSVKNLQAAQTPTKGFIEDSYAGVEYTLKNMNWSPNIARSLILITDAGARDADDPLSATGLTAKQLNQLAHENKVAIFVLHLLTPDDLADHERAKKQYLQLSDYSNIGSLYYGVTAGNLKEFGEVIDSLARQLATQIEQVQKQNKIAGGDGISNSQLEALRAKVAKLGYALQLRYLRGTPKERAPDAFNAWILDKDFRNPERKTVDVCVLLTRDQLSDLHGILRQVLETAEQGLISPSHFLDELKSIAATITRDPGQLGATTAVTKGQGSSSLAEMGFLREYIEDLPYTGEVMNLVLDDWQNWTTERQVEFLHRLEDKISYYRALHDHTDLWISLNGGAIDGSSVYAVPLEMLP